jgi:hypothetical protein
MPVNPLDRPIVFSTPRRMPRISAWREHIPFGMWLVDMVRPAVLVELGTHTGTSYCAFCQAVDELGLATRSYAVDTWKGDEHSGTYGAEVLAELQAHHDPLYGRFSNLIQSSFDEALAHFSEGTIDLLHLDGCHTYEAVRHDFDAWLPKLSDRGVVLLHDTNSRQRDFGVWRLWDELRETYPSFELLHAHGLGTLAVGEHQPEGMRSLCSTAGDDLVALQSFFALLGSRLRLMVQLEKAHALAAERARKTADLKRRVARLTDEIAELGSQCAELESRRVAAETRFQEVAESRTFRYASAARRRLADARALAASFPAFVNLARRTPPPEARRPSPNDPSEQSSLDVPASSTDGLDDSFSESLDERRESGAPKARRKPNPA